MSAQVQNTAVRRDMSRKLNAVRSGRHRRPDPCKVAAQTVTSTLSLGTSGEAMTAAVQRTPSVGGALANFGIPETQRAHLVQFYEDDAFLTASVGDYLAGGRPIVYYGGSTYDPVSEVGLGFTVPPGNPEALADAFEKLAELSPEQRREMGSRARQYLLEHHNIPNLATRLLEAFRDRADVDEVAKSGLSH